VLQFIRVDLGCIVRNLDARRKGACRIDSSGVLAGLLYCGRAWELRPSSGRPARASCPGRRGKPPHAFRLPWLAAQSYAAAWSTAVADVRSHPHRCRRGIMLLTIEGAATALMAWFVFHENFDRRIALGMLCLVLGAAVLSCGGPRR